MSELHLTKNVFCACGRWKYSSEYESNESDKTNNDNCPLCSITRNPDGTLLLRNANISKINPDFLYHLGLGSGTHDLPEMFGDVKFVCMGGSAHRMQAFAKCLQKELDLDHEELIDLTGAAHRYSLYKIGPVISVNHGMGFSSCTILLHEMIKLMYHSNCKDPVFIRIGTSGGVGVEPGTVVISSGALDARMRDFYEIPIAGKLARKSTRTDINLVEDIQRVVSDSDPFRVIVGKTMAATDFYEEQGRLDGAFCEISDSQKLDYLKKLYDCGVRNIEMESVPFFAYTHYSGIKSADVCVTLLDRLNGDQILTPKSKLSEYENYPQQIIVRYIKKKLGEDNNFK